LHAQLRGEKDFASGARQNYTPRASVLIASRLSVPTLR